MTRPLETLNSSASSATAKAAPPPFDAAANVESDFVVILSALLCTLICVVGLIAVTRCAWLRRATGTGQIPRPPPSANKGVKKKVLQSLPKFTYNDSSAADSKFAAECAICLGEFGEGEELRVLPQCGHAFHVACIDTWLGSHSSCPSCRQVLGAARCQRCGGIPAAACGSGTMATEGELKGREDIEEGSGRNSDGGFLP